MSLMPKRVKYRKQQRGKMKGNATRGNYVAYGDYGLQALETVWLSGRQIEAGRIAAQHFLRRAGKLLLPADTLSASRDYSFQPNRILAKEAEEAQLREFLQGEMAELLLLRLEVGLREMPPEPANVVPLAPAPAPSPAG